MHLSPVHRARSVLLVVSVVAATATTAVQAQGSDVTLASTPTAKITKLDFDASILRIPENNRFGFVMSQERINKEIDILLQTRAIADVSRKQGLDADPVYKARVALYADRLLAEAEAAKIDVQSATEFETKRPAYLARAREQFLVNKEKFRTEETVKASHILITTNGRTPDEALAKIKSLREQLLAGASFADIAAANSEDSSVKLNRGDLGFFTKGQMDPAFEAAAFAMSKPGQLSDPVRSRFGYHLIRFEEKKESRPITFEDALPELMEKLKNEFVAGKRAEAFKAIYNPAKVQWNEPAVAALRKSVDPELTKSVTK